MKIDIFGKNIQLNQALRDYIDEKIGSLERLLANQGPVSARVEIAKPSRHHRTGPVFYAEASIKMGKVVFRADANHEDVHAAINEVKSELQIQISNYRKKASSRKVKKIAEIS